MLRWLLWLMFIAVLVGQTVWIIDGHNRPGDIVYSVVALILLLWIGIYGYSDALKQKARYAEIEWDGIRIHSAGVYRTFLQYYDIKSISLKDKISWRDNLRESFTWHGRDQSIRGRHVEIRCYRPHRAGHWLRGKTRVFRLQLAEMERFALHAEEMREQYRAG